MGNFNIKKITAPKLNVADYGTNISEQFNNIDTNFQALANSDFFTGARGEGLKLIEVEPTSSNTFEFREDLEFHDESVLAGSDGTALKNSIINAFKKYNLSNTSWYVGKKYVLYIDNDKKVHNIYPIIYTSETIGVDGKASQDNSYLDFEYVNSVLTLTKSKGYPSLYYDTDAKKYCWLINGAKTGIVAQGKDGLDGLPGPGLDFDIIEVETEPLTDDGFYKISRVYWPKYRKMQKFYLDISSKDGMLNANGSGFTGEDAEWLAGGRDEWINSYGSRTFLVSRTLIEYEEVAPGTGTHEKNTNGTYTQVSGGNYVQKEIPVLHLCKLIHKSAKDIITNFKYDNVDDKDKVEVDPKIDPVVEETTSNNSEPVLMTAAITPNQTGPIVAVDKITIGSMAPVFSTVVSDKTKQEFTTAYDDTKKFVNEISTGKVTSIQYVSNGNKLVEVDLEGTLGSQIKASTAYYADDIYGVYLTKENMHMLTSLISSGSTSGVSLALDDINWTTSNNYALRCLYLKDCAKENGDEIPNSGILIYNSTSSGGNTEKGTLNMRYVGDVTKYRFGGNNQPDPDTSDDKDNYLTLDLGNNGKLVTGTAEVTTLSPENLTVKTSATTKDLIVINSTTTKDLIVENNLKVENNLNVENDLKVTNSTTTKDLTATNSTTKDLKVTNSINGGPKTIQFVSYNDNPTFVPAVGGSGSIVDPSSELERAEVVVDNDIIDNAVGDFVTQTTFDPPVNGSGDAGYPLGIDSMQLVNVPMMLFNIIRGLYDSKTHENIKQYNNTTWVGKNFELKIKYIGNSTAESCHYYHITGYIECFNADSFDDPRFDINSTYLNKLNIDTLVRTKVGVKNDEITHQDLCLKIYNNNVLNWGEEGVLALPYICVYPGSGYNDKNSSDGINKKYWSITSSVSEHYYGLNLAKGRVNMSSVNGPYLLDTYYSGSGVNPYIYRDMHSAWITTTYYEPPKPPTQS